MFPRLLNKGVEIMSHFFFLGRKVLVKTDIGLSRGCRTKAEEKTSRIAFRENKPSST